MANLSSMTRYVARFDRNGGDVTIVRGTFPSTAATASCPVGELYPMDIVTVVPTQAVGSSLAFCEIQASRECSADAGIVYIGTQTGGNSPGTQTVEVRVQHVDSTPGT
jgi:hypothetical protein